MAGWYTGCKVDTVSFSSLGVYSKYYGQGEEANLANLFASIGLLEDAPAPPEAPDSIPGLFRLGFGLTLE